MRLPEGALGGATAGPAPPSRPARIELGQALFAPDSAGLQADRGPVLDKAAQALIARGGGRLLLTAAPGQDALARQRAQAVQAALATRLPAAVAAASRIEVVAGDGSVLHRLPLDTPPVPPGTDRSREGR
ncbi:hypothetical protein D3C72_1816580 [compost metagenome]